MNKTNLDRLESLARDLRALEAKVWTLQATIEREHALGLIDSSLGKLLAVLQSEKDNPGDLGTFSILVRVPPYHEQHYDRVSGNVQLNVRELGRFMLARASHAKSGTSKFQKGLATATVIARKREHPESIALAPSQPQPIPEAPESIAHRNADGVK